MRAVCSESDSLPPATPAAICRSTCRAGLAALQAKKEVNILAIESSCDETAAAVIQNGRKILSSAVFTQIPLHAVYGGVVPEIASRAHVDAVDRMVDYALNEADMKLRDVDAIGDKFYRNFAASRALPFFSRFVSPTFPALGCFAIAWSFLSCGMQEQRGESTKYPADSIRWR